MSDATATRSGEYTKISGVIVDPAASNAISVHFADDGADVTVRRLLWPHVLGITRDGATEIEMALCYQYRDDRDPTQIDTPHPSKKNFRCFRVSKLKNLAVIAFSAPPPPNNWHPFKFTYKQVRKQNCVEEPEVFR